MVIMYEEGTLFYAPEQPVPANTFVDTHPDDPGFPYDVVFRNKTPEAAVLAQVPVVTHHPVVIHLESVLVCFLAVNDKFIVLTLQGIALVNAYNPFINVIVVGSECKCGAFFWNPDGAKKVDS